MTLKKNQFGDSNQPPVVLLGAAGTGTAFAAACALRRVWSQSVKIVAMDINPRHLVTTSLLADHFEQVPLSASPEFPAALLDILGRHKVDTYLPLFPEEIALAARLRAEGKIPKLVSVMAPPPAASVACADKMTLCHLLTQHGIPVPKTFLASEPFAAEEFFLKPRDGTGSRGARKVAAEECHKLVGSHASEWVLQEICSAPEVTVDAFCDPATGFDHAVCRERIEIKSGVSTKSRLFADEELRGYAQGISKALDLAGSFCFQVMRNAAGWVVTDVNPRPGAATAMCVLTGNDFFAATFARCWEVDTRQFFQPLEGECFATRQYAEFLMDSRP
jgi:carbamoylphosphate synthase large subunit